MNRAERRRAKKAGIPVKKEPVVNIKAADVQKIKQDASKEAADKAFLLMLGLPVMVLMTNSALARFGVNGSRMLFLNCMIALKKVMCPLKIFT